MRSERAHSSRHLPGVRTAPPGWRRLEGLGLTPRLGRIATWGVQGCAHKLWHGAWGSFPASPREPLAHLPAELSWEAQASALNSLDRSGHELTADLAARTASTNRPLKSLLAFWGRGVGRQGNGCWWPCVTFWCGSRWPRHHLFLSRCGGWGLLGAALNSCALSWCWESTGCSALAEPSLANLGLLDQGVGEAEFWQEP